MDGSPRCRNGVEAVDVGIVGRFAQTDIERLGNALGNVPLPGPRRVADVVE